MKKTYLSILLAGCLATPILAGCAHNENASSNVSASETADKQAVDPDGTHTVVDHAGNTVEVPIIFGAFPSKYAVYVERIGICRYGLCSE